MPYVTSWPHKRALALVAACFALAVAAQPAAAATPTTCPDTVSSTVFAALGDTANYTPVTGGTFEGDMSGWTLNSASVAPGNEPWQVDGASDSKSLSIAPGGTATSSTFCVSSKTPSWRFFAHAADSSPGTVLRVYVQATLPNGKVIQLPVAKYTGDDYSSWAATPSMVLGKVLPPNFNVNVRFVFAADSKGGAWSIDDVFVDPYAK
ncbi:MAG: hypothetical protein ACXVUL_05420 [Solirubrobacteraceae bacterium]